VLAAVAVILFGALGTRLWFLQTVEATELQTQVDQRNTERVQLRPERGQIFDVDGRLLAGNEATYNVVVDWAAIRRDSDRAELFRRLSGWVDQPVEAMEDRYDANLYSPLLPLPVAEDVGENVAVALRERIEDFPGVSIETGYRRVYPYAPLASHVIGYMGAITDRDAERYEEAGYIVAVGGEEVGRAGVELSYEPVLHGQWGEIVYEVDSAGRIVREVSRTEPVNGRDIQLSIDLDVQLYAERLLQTKLYLQRAFPAPNPIIEKPNGERQRMDINNGPTVRYEAPAGSVIVMNHETGQIVAMASYPTFDNRWFSQDISGERFEELFAVRIDTPECGDEGQPVCRQDPDEASLTNRAVQGQYNMGSTFKPFVAWAALQNGLIRPGDYIEDTGTYRATGIDDWTCAQGIKCVWRNSFCAATNGPCVYGSIDTYWSLAVSSDVFYYRLGELFSELPDTDREFLQNQVSLFSFGADTGVDLPYEFDGRLPTNEVKEDLVDRGVLAENEEPRVLLGDVINLSIGQGLLAATPMQLAVGYGAFANGGWVMVPRVVQAIYPPNTPAAAEPGFVDFRAVDPTLVERTAPTATREVPIEPEIRDEIVGGIRQNITGPGTNNRSTTAEELFDVGYPDWAIQVAGKTGTAQGRFSYPWNDSSVFAAFSIQPEQPYTVVAYLEKSGFGSRGAAPVVKCLFLGLSDPSALAPVAVSEPLDPESDQLAPSLVDTSSAFTACMESADAHTVYPGPVDPGRPVD
jgi:penicillin-binding protein 2